MKKTATIFLFFLLSLSVFAQMPHWRFRYFSQKEGLSNTFVNCIAQDSIGFVWLGTVNGLNRFDGIDFKSYKSDRNDSTSLPDFHITHLFTDAKGILWIITKRGVAVYNRKTDDFRRIEIEGYNIDTQFDASHIECDAGGNLYISSANKLYRCREGQFRFSLFATLPEGNISRFIFDNHNGIWIGLDEGGKLIWFNSQLTSRRVVTLMLKDPKDYCPINGLAWYNNELWAGMHYGGVFSINPYSFEVTEHQVGLPNSESTLFLFRDRGNKLWTIDYTGLKLYDPNTGKYFATYPNFQDPNSIKSNVSGIFEDNQGNYWVIHNKGGVAIHSKDKGFDRITSNVFDYYHLSSSSVPAIAEDKQGSLWFGLDPPSIDVFNYSKGFVEKHSSGTASTNFRGGSIRTLYSDRKGNLWLGAYNGGLQCFDAKTKRFKAFKHEEGNLGSLSHDDVIGMDEDSDGNIWLAVHGSGVDKFSPFTDKFQHFTTEGNNLSNPWANWIICDSRDRVWVASAWGLSLLEKGSSTFKCFYSSTNDTSTLCSSNVYTVYEDNDQTIWVGTDQGLNYYIERTGKFGRVDRGFTNFSILAIRDDELGYLWVSTLSGISRIDKKTFEIFNFGEEDGIQGDEFLQNSALKSNNGMLYFGGIKGVTSINPSAVVFNKFPPPVVITSIKVDGQERTDYRNAISNIDKDYSSAGTLNIAHDHRMISVKFTGLCFNNPDRQSYMIKMQGFVNEWQSYESKREVVFTHLPPGKYVLKIKAANNDGFWNPIETSLVIVVEPAWYGTLTFKILAFVVIIGLFWFIVWLRTKQLNIQRQQLSILVNNKTEELQSYNQELVAQAEYLDSVNKLLAEKQEKVESQARILAVQTEALRKSNRELKQLNQTKDRLFSIIAHDLLNPFTSIMGLAEVFKENYDAMDEKERIELSGAIYTSSNRLFNLLQNLLLWARSQTSSIKFDKQTFPLKDLLEEATEHFHEQIGQKEINFNIVCDPALCAYADVDMVKTIVRNLVNNAIKFTPRNGTIGILASSEKGFAVVSVVDTGVGMSDDDANNLFDSMVVRSTKGTDGESGTGLGLLICKEFVERNGGDISVSSILGAGTTFTFKLPLKAW